MQPHHEQRGHVAEINFYIIKSLNVLKIVSLILLEMSYNLQTTSFYFFLFSYQLTSYGLEWKFTKYNYLSCHQDRMIAKDIEFGGKYKSCSWSISAVNMQKCIYMHIRVCGLWKQIYNRFKDLSHLWIRYDSQINI